jgi:hypothetical protein
MINRGSEWRRWEPHIHGPITIMNNQYGGPNTWDEFDALAFLTRWARQMFPQELIKRKIGEAEKLVRLLETDPATVANRGLESLRGER